MGMGRHVVTPLEGQTHEVSCAPGFAIDRCRITA
jgi:hypothetical protein